MLNLTDDHQLAALGEYALRYVKPRQTVGLGTGRAASAFIRALGAAKLDVRGVATSKASEALARSLGIEVVDLRSVSKVDTDFDGADEVDPKLNLIKGWGGAMVREKIVAAAAKKRVFLVTEEKLVKRLGARRNLPIEVIPLATGYVTCTLAKLGIQPNLRKDSNGSEYISDNGNSVLDCEVTKLPNPVRLDRELCAIPGVVGTGLFVGMTDLVLVATNDGKIKTLRPQR